jgi:hypothetical protein
MTEDVQADEPEFADQLRDTIAKRLAREEAFREELHEKADARRQRVSELKAVIKELFETASEHSGGRLVNQELPGLGGDGKIYALKWSEAMGLRGGLFFWLKDESVASMIGEMPAALDFVAMYPSNRFSELMLEAFGPRERVQMEILRFISGNYAGSRVL